MTSPDDCFIFSKFWLSRLLGGKRAKNGPKWQNSVCLTPYLRNHTSYDCGFWCRCVKWYLQHFCFFKILIFWFFLSHSIFQKLLIISSRFFFVHRCKIASVFLYIFLKKINIVNIKILAFFIGPLHQLFNKQLFFKFIKKCQTEILRCALPSSYVCDFFCTWQCLNWI